MVEICEEYESEDLMRNKYKIIKINIYAYFSIVYGTVLCFIFEGFRKMYEGTHFVTIVTYYPSYEDNSPLATAVRVLFTIILCILMMTMIFSVDSFTMMYLIMFKYKIITLKQYLEGIRKTFDKECKVNLRMASLNLKNGLIKAIVMHGALIKMCKDIDTAFGAVVTLQLCLSSGSVVSLLLQLAAYLLSDAFFHSGWHLTESPRELLPMILMSTRQAQRPLVMKAFNMIEITYGLFLQQSPSNVLRSVFSGVPKRYMEREALRRASRINCSLPASDWFGSRK
ncbi:7tm odorant receptor domain-containing protein [Phthorimaea operculella]|nr:7tm odorant receptor domain-containing protein [Phthorimaea operculella]